MCPLPSWYRSGQTIWQRLHAHRNLEQENKHVSHAHICQKKWLARISKKVQEVCLDILEGCTLNPMGKTHCSKQPCLTFCVCSWKLWSPAAFCISLLITAAGRRWSKYDRHLAYLKVTWLGHAKTIPDHPQTFHSRKQNYLASAPLQSGSYPTYLTGLEVSLFPFGVSRLSRIMHSHALKRAACVSVRLGSPSVLPTLVTLL